MKKLLTIISTDWHLHRNNIAQVKDIIRQKIKLAVENKIGKVFVLGDIFTSRKAQEEMVLNAFGEILDMFKEANITLVVIAGNHDKVDLKGKESYLTPFKDHPNFDLIEDFEVVSYYGVCFSLLPYFEDFLYKQKLQDLIDFRFKEDDPRINILLTHQAFNGAVNNDGTKVVNDFHKVPGFDKFDMVLVGHYHNRNDQGQIKYIGSICPNNFGEDNEKGFALLYENGKIEYFKPNFKEFQKILIDIDNLSIKDLDKEICSYMCEKNVNYRFELTGDNKKLNSINIESIKKLGVDVKTKSKDIQVNIDSVQKGQRVEFTNESLVEEFKNFCKDEKLNYKEGIVYLNKVLND